MNIGVPKEQHAGERRVALVPTGITQLTKAGYGIIVEAGAGESAGFLDQAYADHGARIGSRGEVLKSEVVLSVRCLGSDEIAEVSTQMSAGQILIGMPDPLIYPDAVVHAAERDLTVFALELVPRTTRAQSMDVLSSQANLAGYKAVLLAAVELPKILPMMTTAAGTIAPAKALIVGAGVAGLQAIATAKRLGAQVTGYDVRPEVKQQIESLGARFLELPIEAESGTGGYAKQMDEAFYQRQRTLMAEQMAVSDLVVTTALIPGKKAPILITKEMAEGMRPGSVIVDIAAERGGNCELTKAGETVRHNGISIIGPVNLAATMPFHASSMYSRNIANFLLNMTKKEGLDIDTNDPIVKESLLCQGGKVVNERILSLLGEEVGR
jgi:NAD(P) transhydrogenase subunit alpha